MDNINTSSENISEALKLLEEAAKQKKSELTNAMADKYTHLRSVIMEAESGLAHSLSDAQKHAVETATHAKDVGVEKAREMVGEVDASAHRNPWTYIEGTAVIGLLLGYVLGRDRK